MQLELASVFVVDFSVTLVIGVVLLLSSTRNSANRALSWWGVAHLVLCSGVVLLTIARIAESSFVQNTGIILILLGYSLMWHAARVFDRRKPRLFLVSAGTFVWLAVSSSGAFASPAFVEFAIYSLLTAVYCFATAYEFWSAREERLPSRQAAIALQLFTGLGFLGWVVMSVLYGVESQAALYESGVFPWIILATLLVRVAVAFIVLAMAKERLELTQRIVASTDALTGLPNRRGFFRRTIRHLRDGNGSPQWAAVLLFDLDHFKSINDRHGHAVGDTVLRIFAESIRQHLSAADYVGRIGGEEFAAFLPGADAARAAAVAERIRESFVQAVQSIDGGTILATVSAGGVAMDCDGWTLDALLVRADAALYSAKSAGRNCVKILGTVWHPGSTPAAHAIGSPSVTVSPPLAPAGQSALGRFGTGGRAVVERG